VKQIGWAVGVMSRHTWWDSKCLAQAIAAQWMLRRRAVPGTLYLGMSKDGAQDLIAHAWVRSGHVILTGASRQRWFTVVSTFAAE
jgi:hypothetical protein